VLSYEADKPKLGLQEQSRIDNYTDAIMLGSAAYAEGSPFQNAIWVNRYVSRGMEPKESFQTIYGNLSESDINSSEIQTVRYPRYWHGYLVAVKPLLVVFNYGQIRVLNGAVLCVLFAAVVFLMLKSGSICSMGIPFLFAVFCMIPKTVMQCLQYSTTTYVMLFAVILLLCQKRVRSTLWYSCFFALVGIATVYVDFLTFPTLSLAIPLCLLIGCLQEKTVWEKTTLTCVCCASWGIGYGGMWAGKWLLGMLFYGPAFLTNYVAESIAFRVSDSYAEEQYSRVEVIAKRLEKSFLTKEFRTLFYIIVGCLLIWLVVCCIRDRKHYYLQLLPYMVILCVPFVWTFVLCNHSAIHWFTYRTFVSYIFVLPAALFAVLPRYSPQDSVQIRQ